jgi:hypothetical protein
MTDAEFQQAFDEYNDQYFGRALTCDVVITEDWIDDDGHYYPDSAVGLPGDGIFSGTVNNVEVSRASGLYTHAENRIRIPRWKIQGQAAARAVLLHEMAHSAADEPEIDHGPEWHREMNRLWKMGAPINLQDVTPGCTAHELVDQYGVGSEFWESL